MRRYPEYKESGDEFIGEVPKGWRLSKLKYIAQIDNSGVWGEERGMLEIDAPVSTTAHLTPNGNWLFDKMPIRSFSKADYEYYSGTDGDIIVVKSSGSATNIITGKVGFIDNISGGIVFGNFLMRVKPNREKYVPKFLYYFLASSITRERVKRLVSTTTYPNLKVDEYVANSIPIPCTYDEQTQIANFLDHKTGQIDELIRAKERKIELLGEYRASLINQAVTKGLDPNVEMKPSGLAWIGEIPKDWKTINTKYLFRLVTERAPKNNDYELLSIYTEIGVKPRKELEERGNRATTTDGYWLVKKGDFIVNKLLAWMGAIGLSNYEGVTSPAYDILRKIRPLNERFYEYLFRCGLYFTEFKKRSRGIMDVRLRLYFSQFGTIPLVFPPVHEQHEIVNFLDSQTEKIDKLRSNEEHIVKLLKEYRQSLISEAVTGKIDVRGEV